MKTDHQHRDTSILDYVYGVSAFNIYGANGSVAGVQNYSYGFVLNLNGVSITLNTYARSKDYFKSDSSVLKISDVKAEVERGVTRVSRVTTDLRRRVTVVEDHVLRLMGR
jgi:hypothetical protein